MDEAPIPLLGATQTGPEHNLHKRANRSQRRGMRRQHSENTYINPEFQSNDYETIDFSATTGVAEQRDKMSSSAAIPEDMGDMGETSARHLGERGDPEGEAYVADSSCATKPNKSLYGKDGSKHASEAGEEEVCDLDITNWDVFRKYMYESSLYAFEGLFKIAGKVMKVAFILISFGLILTGLVTSKLAVLFATANMNPFVGFRKNDCSGTIAECQEAGKAGDVRWGVPVLYDVADCKSRDVVRWLWCMMLCMCTPYVLTFIDSMWTICFKKKRNPKWSAVFFMLFTETLHTIGLMLLFFIVLPSMDIFRGLFIMNATALLPSFFKLFIRPKEEGHKEANLIADIAGFILQLAGLILYLALSSVSSDHGNSTSCKADDYDYYKGIYATRNTQIGCTVSDIFAANDTDVITYEQCGPGPESFKEPAVFLIPIALLLISCTWWQNYVDKHLQMKCTRWLCDLSRDIRRGKTKIFAIVSLWKIIISFVSLLGVAHYHIPYQYLYATIFDDDRLAKDPPINPESNPFHEHQYVDNEQDNFENDWLIVYAASSISGLVCYFVSVNAIQAKVQKASYSLAIVIATPVTMVLALFGFCGCATGMSIMADGMNIHDLYWNCFDGFSDISTLIEDRPVVIIGLLWWFGQLIVTRHLWTPTSERLVKAERIFIQPFYCGLLLEQSFGLNRSRHDMFREKKRKLPVYVDTFAKNEPSTEQVIRKITDDINLTLEENIERHDDDCQEAIPTLIDDPLYDRADKTEPFIFLCATMWHENEKEMLQMIKSILRLDRDQCHRRLAREFFKVNIKDFYNFEGHIFFDDAFNKYVKGDPEFKVNRFVTLFVRLIDEAATYVHGANIVLDHPKKIPTPYGGKLVYTLPGGNLLYLHLKDKQKIRHRKRWSQVMYMYYLLGHRLWDKDINRKVKEEIAYNTYLLTLDGDVDFKPEAVLLLVDLMRRNFGVGAACGRIHPAGNGPLVWYQKFEYAISHWLQKTTEHVLGCVLCSPGCFSMFRSSALMDDNIMKTYSQTAEEALHYVQYDQGEDRWLCTLLLQRGYRVEYSAAADALTYAPEGFNEFFNQRRRWTPSTFANILDLLSTGGATAKRNQNISILYIIYQAGLMFSSVLGPATIFMMVVSSFHTVFPSISMNGAFFLVLIPIGLFFALCMLAKSGIQLAVAALLGGLFAIAQMVVLVGLVVAIVNDGLCSPTAWFLLGTTAIFIISGLLHPQEMTVLPYGILYFLLIPTMYLLLIIYSLCNMHVVSWGTREVVQTAAEKERLAQRELELSVQKAVATPAAAAAAAPGGIKGMFGGMFGGSSAAGGDGEDGWTWSCGDACRCMCCPRPGHSQTDGTLVRIEKEVAVLSAQVGKVVSALSDESSSDSDVDETMSLLSRGRTASTLRRKASSRATRIDDASNPNPILYETPQPDYDMEDHGPDTDTVPKKKEVEPKIEYSDAKPYWTQDVNAVGKGYVDSLEEKEEDFWKHLIRRYLLPIDQNPEREERIKKDLLSLRNKAVIGFFMIDLLFIALIQTLQMIPVDLSTAAPGVNSSSAGESGYYVEFTCYDPVNEVTTTQYIEPVGFAFLMVFGVFLVIQFLGMFMHRLFSLIQIVSSTVLIRRRSNNDNMSFMKLTETMAKLEDQKSPDSMSTISSADLDSRRQSVQGDVAFDDEAGHMSRGQTGDVIKRLQEDRKIYTTIGKTFAQRFLALTGTIDPDKADALDANRKKTEIMRRATNVFRTPSETTEPHTRPQHSNLKRTKTRGADALLDIARRRADLFQPDRQEQIKRHYRLSATDIAGEADKIQRRLPEVREFRTFSENSHVVDGGHLEPTLEEETGTF